jgi:hypothetical protein
MYAPAIRVLLIEHNRTAARLLEKQLPAITVSDEGAGFDPEQSGQPDSGCGFGLFSIRDCLHPAGGRLDIECAAGAGSRCTTVPPAKSTAMGPAGGKCCGPCFAQNPEATALIDIIGCPDRCRAAIMRPGRFRLEPGR